MLKNRLCIFTATATTACRNSTTACRNSLEKQFCTEFIDVREKVHFSGSTAATATE